MRLKGHPLVEIKHIVLLQRLRLSPVMPLKEVNTKEEKTREVRDNKQSMGKGLTFQLKLEEDRASGDTDLTSADANHHRLR